MTVTPPSTPKRNGARWIMLVGVLLVTGLGWHFGFANLTELLRGAQLSPLLWMAALILAGFWIRALKWHAILGVGNEGILIFFIAKTAGNWTPGRAGELAPLLMKQHRNARVAAWIALDRAVEVSWTLGLGVMGAAALGILSIWALVGIGGGTLLLGTLAWRMSRGSGGVKSAVNHADSPPWRTRLRQAALRLREELLLFRHKMPLVMVLTLVAKVTDIYAVIVLCQAFGYAAGFLVVCAARCAHGLISAIPVTPDATGVPFIAAAFLLHEHAGIPYDTLMAALALEVIVINAILWASFCLASAGRWKPIKTG